MLFVDRGKFPSHHFRETSEPGMPATAHDKTGASAHVMVERQPAPQQRLRFKSIAWL
jgi:hypothetical protein